METRAYKLRTELRRRRVTINDVAAQIGLTKSTVSRALNGYPDISERTRLRVWETAQALGYRPLANAQAMRTGRLRSIGLVLQLNEHDCHRPFLADFLAGVSEAASAADWTIAVATATSDEDTLRLLCKLADERKADGFILPRTLWDDPRVSLLRDAEVPFVLYGRTADSRGCAWFDIKSECAMADAVARLAALGHTRIGFIAGPVRYTYARLRLDGYRDGLAQTGLPYDPSIVGPPALGVSEGQAAMLALLTQTITPPTAIICSTDLGAVGAYRTAAALGLAIGTDLSIISYDGIPEGELLDPPLSTFCADARAAGARLTELLIDRISGRAPESLRELAPAVFMQRRSHGPATLTPAQLSAKITTNKPQWEDLP